MPGPKVNGRRGAGHIYNRVAVITAAVIALIHRAQLISQHKGRAAAALHDLSYGRRTKSYIKHRGRTAAGLRRTYVPEMFSRTGRRAGEYRDIRRHILPRRTERIATPRAE